MTTASEEFLSPEEVGERLGVSVYTVRRWIKAGQLRAFRPGKEYRIQESDLEEFLRAREVRPKLQGPPSDPGQRSFENHLRDEQHGEWGAAVRSARQLREHGPARMDELLSAWRESKERGENADARRGLRAKMGELLQDAYEAQTALLTNIGEGLAAGDREAANLLAAGAKEVPNPGWTEVQEAESFYLSLINAVLEVGLSVRRGYKAHEVQDAA